MHSTRFRSLLRPLPALVLLNVGMLVVNGLLWAGGWSLAERFAARRLESALGRARSCRVHLWDTTFLDLLRGRVSLARVEAQRLRLKNGLRLALLQVVARGVEGGPGALRRLDTVRFYVRIREADLNRFLRLRSGGGLKPIPVASMHPGELEVSARKLGLPLPMRIRGSLVVDQGTRIHFVLRDRGSISDLVVSSILWVLNPLVDLRDADLARYGVTVEQIRLSEGTLELEGWASPPMPFVFPKRAELEVPDDPDEPDEPSGEGS